MISCCKASEIEEKKRISSISVMERIKLKIHSVVCAGCKAYTNHSKFLEDAYKKIKLNKTDAKLSLAKKESILKSIQNN